MWEGYQLLVWESFLLALETHNNGGIGPVQVTKVLMSTFLLSTPNPNLSL